MLPIGRLDAVKYADEMLAIHDECYGKTLEPPDPHTGMWWGAWDGDELVAFAQMIEDPADPLLKCARDLPLPSGAVYFSRDAVLPAYQGQGIQKRLIRIRLAAARRMGYYKAVTDTYCENFASLNSYVGCGFKFFDPAFPWMGKGEMYLQRPLC